MQANLKLPTKTKQLNVRLDEALLNRFRRAAEDNQIGLTEVTEMLIILWCDHCEDRAVRHLDGSECPMSAMIRALSDATRAQLLNPKMLKKGGPQ